MLEKPEASVQAGRWQFGVRECLVGIACIAVLVGAGRTLWDYASPVRAKARGLRADDPSERVTAAMQLADAKPEDAAIAIASLTAALRDPDADVRMTAAQSLRTLLLAALKRNDVSESVLAARSQLKQMLKDSSTPARLAAVQTLAAVEDALHGRRTKAKGPAVAPIDPELLISAAMGTISDKDPTSYRAAFATLAEVGRQTKAAPPPGLIAALEDLSPTVRAAATVALDGFHTKFDPAIRPLFQCLRDEDVAVRLAASTTLEQKRPTPALLPFLFEQLADDHGNTRTIAARLLGVIGPKAERAVPTLIKMLDEPPPPAPVPGPNWEPLRDSSREAALALGRIAPGTASADVALAALCKSFPGASILLRSAIATALGDFRSKALPSVPMLVAALKRPVDARAASPSYDEDDRDQIARALGFIAPGTSSAPEVVEALSEALEIKSVRSAAAFALAQFGPDAAPARPALTRFEKTDDGTARRGIAAALDAIEASQRGTPSQPPRVNKSKQQ